MKLTTLLVVLILPLAAKTDTVKRIDAATETLSEIMGAPDKGIPQDLLDKSQCAVIVPGVLKGGFIFAAKYGRGFAVCRSAGGRAGARRRRPSRGRQLRVSDRRSRQTSSCSS